MTPSILHSCHTSRLQLDLSNDQSSVFHVTSHGAMRVLRQMVPKSWSFVMGMSQERNAAVTGIAERAFPSYCLKGWTCFTGSLSIV